MVLNQQKAVNSLKKPILVIMAAGLGSRYGGLKQMDPLGPDGEIILDFSCYDAMRAGFEDVIFIIKKENEADFRALVEPGIGKKMNVRYAFQDLGDLPEGFTVPEGRVKPWGTCHAVYAARDLIDAPFAVLNADDYYGPEAFKVLYDFLCTVDDARPLRTAMVGYILKNTMTENGSVSRGICTANAEGLLTGVVERTKIAWKDGVPVDEAAGPISADSICSMNFWGFPAAVVSEIGKDFPAFLRRAAAENPLKGEFFIPSFVDLLIHDGRASCKVLSSHDKWFGVTYHEDRPGVMEAFRQLKADGLYPKGLWD